MKDMLSFDLEDLLRRVTETGQEVPEAVRQVFSSLVQTTLNFRDRQLQEFGTTVTVEDVRIALGWLMEFLTSGKMPQTDHLLRQNLFEVWVSGLKSIRK